MALPYPPNPSNCLAVEDRISFIVGVPAFADLPENTAFPRPATKNFDAKPIVDEILAIDEKRRSTQTNLDGILAQLNKASKEIGELYKAR